MSFAFWESRLYKMLKVLYDHKNLLYPFCFLMAGLSMAGWSMQFLWQVIPVIHRVTVYECEDVAHSLCSGCIRSFVVMLVCKSQVKICR